MKDYRVTVKVRNNRILKAIEEAGGQPGQKWCEQHGLTYGDVNDLINMTAGPLDRRGALRHVAQLLCDVLDKIPDDLWSQAQLYPLETNFSDIELDHNQVLALLPAADQSYLPDDSPMSREKQRALLDAAMESLTDRERQVLTLRFEDDLTLEAAGKEMGGISRERVRAIEQKALRKLRHPTRVAILEDCAPPEGDRWHFEGRKSSRPKVLDAESARRAKLKKRGDRKAENFPFFLREKAPNT